jgi:hypothetical protein
MLSPRSIALALAAAVISVATLHAQTLNTLYTFADSKFGRRPDSGAIVGTHGELYGTTLLGACTGGGSASVSS